MLTGVQDWWNRPCGGREVLVISLPLIVSTVSWTMMYFIDRVFLTWYSRDALAAAMPAACVSFTVLAMFLGIASYANTFVAQYFGAGRPQRIGLVVWQAIAVALATIPLLLATIPLAPWFFGHFGHGEQVVRYEVIYYQILCVGGGGQVLGAALAAFFTGRGEMRTVMFADAAAVGTNIVLDYLWIFGYGGFPEWGVAGAAWATVVALWVKPAILIPMMLRRANRERYGTLSGCRIDWPLLKRLVRFGFPAGVQLALEVGAFTIFVVLVGRLGEGALEATNLAFGVNTLAFMPVLGFGIATTTLVGQRLGEDRPDLAAQAVWSLFWLGTAYMAAFGVAYVLVPDLMLFAHTSQADPETFGQIRELTIVLLRFVAAYCLFDTMNIVFVSALKGAGDTRFILYTTLAMAAALAGGTWITIDVLGQNVLGAWGFATAWVCAMGVVYLARFMQGKWRTMRVIESVAEETVEAKELEEVALAAD